MDINALVSGLDQWLWGWPLVGFVICVGLIFTVALKGMQFRYFFSAWRFVLSPEKGDETAQNITPLQAFLNVLNSSIGNGSMAGMATAVVGGGPGAAFWVLVCGSLYLVIRYAEVYMSAAITERMATGAERGGPMVYLRHVFGGRVCAFLYAFFAFGMSMVAGNAMQCNSIRLGVERLTGLSPWVIAGVIFAFMVYVMLGGARRIIRLSETIVPIKVGIFFVATSIALLLQGQVLWGALKTIVYSAFNLQAVGAGVLGFSVQQAIRYGMSRTLNATEVGLGIAGILYGAAKQKDPVRSGIMSMASAFITSYLVCFSLMLLIVATGAWDIGLQSTAVTMAAYETVFGVWGGVLVTILTIAFGMGVLVTYAFIARECWLYLTGGRYERLYTVLYCLMAVWGTLSRVEIVWNATNIANAGLIVINLYGLVYLLPSIRTGLHAWEARK